MTLSDQAIQRLTRLGYVSAEELKFWRDLWQSEGESFFWSFLQQEENARKKYQRWFPQLQAFAAECRRVLPVPALASFSSVEREQYRVLSNKMQEFAASEDGQRTLNSKPNRAVILSTSWVGLGAAQQFFEQQQAIVLSREEQERWFAEVYPSESEAFQWWTSVWWSLSEGLDGEDEASLRHHYPIPDDCSYWVVVSGVQWGGLAGGANHELWRWDGKRAEFIDVYCVDTF